jgi:hypothetical protein
VHKTVKVNLEVSSPHLMQGNIHYIEEQADKLRSILDELDSLMDRNHVEKLRKLYVSGTRRLGRYKAPPIMRSERPNLNATDIECPEY